MAGRRESHESRFILEAAALGGRRDLAALTVREELNCPTEMRAMVRFNQNELPDPEKVIDQQVTVRMHGGADGTERKLVGIVARADVELAAEHDRENVFEASYTIVSRTWRLNRWRQTRIFQNDGQTFRDVVDSVLKEAGYEPSEISGDPPGLHRQQPFIVQYNETSLNFLERLLEDAGASLAVIERDGTDRLVLLERPSEAAPCAPVGRLNFRPSRPSGGAPENQEALTALSVLVELVPKSVRVVDYDYENPGQQVFGEGRPEEGKQGEEYGYPACVKSSEECEDQAAYGVEAWMGRYKVFVGTSDCTSITAGRALSISEHPQWSGEYFIISAVHSFNGLDYVNTFRSVPKSGAFRPLRRAVRPRISGFQAGRVVGEGQDEEGDIHVDAYGRMKVRLPWDLRAGDEAKTEWLRLCHTYSGSTTKGKVPHGVMFLPRVGDQVLVAFEEGNPDRPAIVGSLYDNAQGRPLGLTGEKTRNIIQTPAGSSIVIEDKKGTESIEIRTPDGKNRIFMTNEGESSMEIESKGKLSIKAKSIAIESETSIEVKSKTTAFDAATSFDVKTQKSKMDAGMKYELTTQLGDLKAGAKLTLQSALVTIN